MENSHWIPRKGGIQDVFFFPTFYLCRYLMTWGQVIRFPSTSCFGLGLRASYISSHAPFLIFRQAFNLDIRTLQEPATFKLYTTTAAEMADAIFDSTAAGTAKENIPTMSNPMDNIHGNVEDISNKASGYKANKSLLLFLLSVNRCQRARPPIRADQICRPPCPTPTLRTARRRMQRKVLSSWGGRMRL